MKRIVVFSTAVFCLVACSNPGSNRNDQKQDVEVSYPDAGATGTGSAGQQQSHEPDTSANTVQDSSTTVGYDTSSVRKN